MLMLKNGRRWTNEEYFRDIAAKESSKANYQTAFNEYNKTLFNDSEVVVIFGRSLNCEQ